ncbi:hypothetical protein QBC46DRAFT_117820 [Diplogelasinospora grovesii]|uniref:MADS-box MEF2 type transcription factor MIG1 n=1 Tax=Diplogelasinospora grovesii TaxID=303347 RepID=A0AAN6NIL1_9PEZI|nr:hypothetical protein QBC46DRAFT_117820 [Diplogelasinospora grovesii]
MGRRKIEIKAIKDDRNRSVTFLKRKGGLFKKAHELSVLCSVDVAVIIFGTNKKLYEFSSGDMHQLITKYTYHGGPNEHKGPADFNGGVDEDDDDEDGTPPQSDGMEPHMLPPHFQSQPPFPPHIRHSTPSASPPIPNGVFGAHPGGHGVPRGHTPQPQMGSRPSSRNDVRRMGPGMPGTPQPPAVNGFAYMPQPAIYNPQNAANLQPPMPQHVMPQSQPHPQYPYASPQAHAPQMSQYVEDQRRSSLPPNLPPHGAQGPPAPRHSVSPPQPPPQQLPPQPGPHMSPPPPQPQHQPSRQQQAQQQQPQIQVHPMRSPPQPHHQAPSQQQDQQSQQSQQHLAPQQDPQPSAPVQPKIEPIERPQHRQSLLLDTAVKKQPQRKQGSIFTPIDENRSILSQHLAAFHPEPKSEGATLGRAHSIDVGSVSRNGNTSSPPPPQRAATQGQPPFKRNGSLSSIPETTFTPPSRSNSLRVGSSIGGGVARPRLKVQIPDEPSDGGSATAESASPRGITASTDATSQPSRRPTDSHGSGVVLPPPSPSASALLSAGASGPPNPFARPLPNRDNSNMDINTPVSALPSRFMNNEFLPSPSSFYPEWNFRGTDSNTLPSPLNFATPVVGTGPSFLRDDPSHTPHKRKSPEMNGNSHAHDDLGSDAKRIKIEMA